MVVILGLAELGLQVSICLEPIPLKNSIRLKNQQQRTAVAPVTELPEYDNRTSHGSRWGEGNSGCGVSWPLPAEAASCLPSRSLCPRQA